MKYDDEVVIQTAKALKGEDWDSLPVKSREKTVTEIVATFDSLERAPWWREVTDPDEVIPRGCPTREEWGDGGTQERVYDKSIYRKMWRSSRLFIDTRWSEEDRPLEVGDTVASEGQASRLPDNTIVSRNGISAQKIDGLWFFPGILEGEDDKVVLGGTVLELGDQE